MTRSNQSVAMRVLTVSELTANLKALVETSFGIVWVAGEVSNLRRPGSGHLYFTLKDDSSQVRAVMFRNSAASVGFALEDGQSLVCRGRLTIYTARGDFQVVVEAVEPRGVGALQVAFEQLKQRLEKEGLFEIGRKRELPSVPSKVGIITSPTGAALRDILTVMGRRFPTASILIAPVRVQGEGASAEMVESLEILNGMDDIDVIIIARGGGSLEDLQPFNNENLARAVYQSRIPVVSAVGHETDWTITDFVADLRAPTPSAAAELVVPDRRDLIAGVASLASRMTASQAACRRDGIRRVQALHGRLFDPGGRINDLRIYLDERVSRLEGGIGRILDRGKTRAQSARQSLRHLSPLVAIRERRRTVQYLMNKATLQSGYLNGIARGRVERAAAVLDSMSPEAVLKRGYSITRRQPEGTIVTDGAALRDGDEVSVQVMSGAFCARVITTSQESSRGR